MTDLIKSEYAPDDFYRAFAIGILRWQYVEHELYLLYHALENHNDVQKSSTRYYKCNFFGKKLKLVNDTAKSKLLGESLENWNDLKVEISDASDERNFLAHLTAAPEFKDDNSFKLVLAPAIYVSTNLIKTKKRLYDRKGCEELASLFDDLAYKIEAFTNAV